MIDLGTVRPGKTIRIPFSSFDKDDGSSITMTNYAVGDILIYKDGSTTERASTAGYTATTDFDAKTGKHLAIIDLADNTTAGFFAAGSEYLVAIDAVTVDAVTTGGWIARFEIGYPDARLNTTIATLSTQTSFTLTAGPAEDDALNGFYCIIHDVASAVQQGHAIISDYTGSTKTVTLAAGTTFTAAATDNISIMGPAPLQPTVAARTLDVSTGGEAGVDWANVGTPGSTVSLSATTVATVTTTTTATNVTTVNGLAAGVITAASIAADAITDAKVAADVTIASVTGSVGSVTGAVGSVTAGVTVTTNNDKTGYALSAAGVDAIWDEATAGHITAGTYGVAVTDILTDTGTTLQAELDGIQADTEDIQTRIPAALVGGRIDASIGAAAANTITASALAADAAAEIADAVWDEAQADHVAIGSFGIIASEIADILVDTAEIGAAGAGLTALATQSSVNTIDDFLDTEIAAIKAKTDSLTFTKALELDVNLQSVNGVTVNGDGAATPMGV